MNLIEERIDIAVRAREAALQDPGLVARKIGSGRFIVVASEGYVAEHGSPETPEQLVNFDTIGSLGGGPEQTWALVTTEERSVRITHRPRLLCSDLTVQYQAVLSGVGIALLPQRIASRGLTYGALIQLIPDWATPDEGIHVVFASRRGLLPSVRALLDYMEMELPKALAG